MLEVYQRVNYNLHSSRIILNLRLKSCCMGSAIEPTPLKQKPTTEEIRTRFDPNVARFSNLETGPAASIDVPLAMELISFN